MASMSASAYMWPEISDAARAVTRAAYSQYQQTEHLTRGEIEHGQHQQLTPLLAFAAQNVPFYRDALDGDMVISGDRVASGFERLPVLTLGDVQRLGPRLQASYHFSSHGMVQEITLPAPDGQVVRFRGNRLTSFFAYMPYLRAMDWYDWLPESRLAEIAPSGHEPQLKPKEHPDWGTPFDSGPRLSFCGDADASRQLSWLAAFKPNYLTVAHDKFGALVETAIASHAAHFDMREVLFANPNPGALSAQAVEDVFGARLRRGLNLPMLGLVALECPAADTLHLQSENFIAEILDANGQPTRPGVPGTLVITDLHNFIMPFLRFNTGITVADAGACPCGRGLHALRLAG